MDSNDIESSERYIYKTLATNKIDDSDDQEKLDYFRYSIWLAGNILAKLGDKKVTEFWKNIYKSCQRSEANLNYKFYKGHVLVKWALSLLVSHGDLDRVIELLKQACQEDIDFGYKNTTFRPAYKILSFLQPITVFRSKLWPSNKAVRLKVANRLYMSSYMNKASIGMAYSPDMLKNSIKKCIGDNIKLLDIILENSVELQIIMEKSYADKKFYKSAMFLIGNIVEGILYNLAERSKEPSKQRKTHSLLKIFFKDKKNENFKSLSIEGLSVLLCKKKVFAGEVKFYCRFVQHYRDFVHPVRNIKHGYQLNYNFNKMFMFFLVLLLDDLSHASDKLT